MKKSNLFLVVLVGILVLGFSCTKKDDVKPEPKPVILDHEFIGTWDIYEIDSGYFKKEIVSFKFVDLTYTFFANAKAGNFKRQDVEWDYYHWFDYNPIEKTILVGNINTNSINENNYLYIGTCEKYQIIENDALDAWIYKNHKWNKGEYITAIYIYNGSYDQYTPKFNNWRYRCVRVFKKK